MFVKLYPPHHQHLWIIDLHSDTIGTVLICFLCLCYVAADNGWNAGWLHGKVCWDGA